MAKEVVVTREGYKKLEQDLNELRTVKRKEVADKIKVARGYGDLSENAEYDAAKEEQAIVEARIADLEATLKVARIIDDSELSNDTVSIGMRVKILAEGDDPDEAEEYDITGLHRGGHEPQPHQRREPGGRCPDRPQGRRRGGRYPAQRQHHRVQGAGRFALEVKQGRGGEYLPLFA